ncbi:MAG: hypothetical protein ACLP1X_23600 [Polyangiaceae bacterium]
MPTLPKPSRQPFQRLATAAVVAAGVAALTGTACASARAEALDGGPGPLEDGATGFPEDAGTGIEGNEDAGSGVIFYGAPGVSDLACMTSAGCLPGQVCCFTLNLTASCQAGSCASGLQLCGVSAECIAGDTCASSPIVMSLGVMIMTCNPPSDDGGSPSDGSSGPAGGDAEDSPPSDGDDTGISDAPTIPGD